MTTAGLLVTALLLWRNDPLFLRLRGIPFLGVAG